jgi:site-specific recombinase XerD
VYVATSVTWKGKPLSTRCYWWLLMILAKQGSTSQETEERSIASSIVLQRRYYQLCLKNKFDADNGRSQIGLKKRRLIQVLPQTKRISKLAAYLKGL